MAKFDLSIPAPAITQLRVLILLGVLTPCVALAQNTTLEVITLRHRTAEQMMPVLKPLLDKQGTLSGMQNQLIVRTTPSNLAELKRVLATLDAAPRRLMVSVRHDAMLDQERNRADVSGRVSADGGSVAITAGSAASRGGTVDVQGGDANLRGRVESTRSLDANRNVQSVQVLEGNTAFIRTGQSVAVPQRQIVRSVVNGQVIERVNTAAEYRDVLTGFYVLPRLAGDRVTLEINPQRDTLAAPEQNLPRGSVNIQHAATTVSGRLGEWIELGGVAQGVSNQNSTVLGSTRDVAADHRRILVKVEEVR